MSRKIRVLVVDDDNLLHKLVTDQLARSGFDTAAAASGQEALDSLRATDCDVVLLDIQMPGLSGLDALRAIRKMEDAPEVVMLTADTSLATGMPIPAMRQPTRTSSASESVGPDLPASVIGQLVIPPCCTDLQKPPNSYFVKNFSNRGSSRLTPLRCSTKLTALRVGSRVYIGRWQHKLRGSAALPLAYLPSAPGSFG